MELQLWEVAPKTEKALFLVTDAGGAIMCVPISKISYYNRVIGDDGDYVSKVLPTCFGKGPVSDRKGIAVLVDLDSAFAKHVLRL